MPMGLVVCDRHCISRLLWNVWQIVLCKESSLMLFANAAKYLRVVAGYACYCSVVACYCSQQNNSCVYYYGNFITSWKAENAIS